MEGFELGDFLWPYGFNNALSSSVLIHSFSPPYSLSFGLKRRETVNNVTGFVTPVLPADILRSGSSTVQSNLDVTDAKCRF